MLAPPQPTLLLEYCMVSWSCLQSTVVQTPTPGASDAGSSRTNTPVGILLHGKLIMSSIKRHTNTNTWSVWCWLLHNQPSYKHQHLECLMLAPREPTLLLEYCMVSWSCLQSTVIQTPTPRASDAGSSTTNTPAGILHGKLIMSSINRHTNTNTWSVWCWLLENQHSCWNTAW